MWWVSREATARLPGGDEQTDPRKPAFIKHTADLQIVIRHSSTAVEYTRVAAVLWATIRVLGCAATYLNYAHGSRGLTGIEAAGHIAPPQTLELSTAVRTYNMPYPHGLTLCTNRAHIKPGIYLCECGAPAIPRALARALIFSCRTAARKR